MTSTAGSSGFGSRKWWKGLGIAAGVGAVAGAAGGLTGGAAGALLPTVWWAGMAAGAAGGAAGSATGAALNGARGWDIALAGGLGALMGAIGGGAGYLTSDWGWAGSAAAQGATSGSAGLGIDYARNPDMTWKDVGVSLGASIGSSFASAAWQESRMIDRHYDEIQTIMDTPGSEGGLLSAANRAAELFGFEMELSYDPQLPPGKVASTDTRNGQVALAPAAFDSPSDLVSTLLHEEVHVQQVRSGNMGISGISEVEAYDAELANSGRLKLSSDQIADITGQRARYFNELDHAYRQQVRQGNYRQRPADIQTLRSMLQGL